MIYLRLIYLRKKNNKNSVKKKSYESFKDVQTDLNSSLESIDTSFNFERLKNKYNYNDIFYVFNAMTSRSNVFNNIINNNSKKKQK